MIPERHEQFKGQFDPLPAQKTANPQERMKRLNTTSWETTKGILEFRTHNNPKTNSFFLNHLDQVRQYYDYVYKKTVEGEAVTRDIPLLLLYENIESILPSDSILASRKKSYSPLFRIVREAVTKKPERSRGYRKHIREEKAFARRNAPLK